MAIKAISGTLTAQSLATSIKVDCIVWPDPEIAPIYISITEKKGFEKETSIKIVLPMEITSGSSIKNFVIVSPVKIMIQ